MGTRSIEDAISNVELLENKKRAKKVKIIIWYIIAVLIMVLTILLSKPTIKSFLPTFAVLAISYCILSIRILNGTQKGVKKVLGIPYAFVRSGFHFVCFPFEQIIIYSTREQYVDVKEQKVTTIKGTFTPKKGKPEECSSTTLTIDGFLYFSWPNGIDLIRVYLSIPNPNQPEKIKNFFMAAFTDGIRAAGTKTTWRHCMQESFINEVSKMLENRPLKDSGKLFNYRVALPKVDPPEDLTKALDKPQIAMLEKEATITKSVGEAEARQNVLNVILARPDGIRYEYLLALRDMAKDPSTKFYQLPDRFKFDLGNAGLGGKSPKEIVDLLGGEGVIEGLIDKAKE